jgi:hypothetical protein
VRLIIVQFGDQSRLRAGEMRFMDRTEDCTSLGHKINVDIVWELNTQPVMEFV